MKVDLVYEIMKDIKKYGYFDENKKFHVVLDEEKLKKIFSANYIEFETDDRIHE